jgi:N-acetylmuramoyl-L-alanine amidase
MFSYKIYTASILTVLFYFGLSSFTPETASVPTYSSNNNGYVINTVVLDAGHGGKDPGAGNGREKKFALDITLKVGRKIKDAYPDVRVIYTRNKDATKQTCLFLSTAMPTPSRTSKAQKPTLWDSINPRIIWTWRKRRTM